VPLLQLKGVRREYPSGESVFVALKQIDLTIEAGESVAIVGASGSGKSTLMNIMGCLDRPTSGSYYIGGTDTADLDADALAALRREHFGFVFQRYHLLSDLSALANVETPAVYAGVGRAERHSRAEQLLNRLGLHGRAHSRPNQLSGGQQQRVSVARALMNGGQVVLADEPTGALDKHSGEEMLKLLRELHRDGHTIIIVTHDPRVAEHADRIIEISDGEIISDTRSSTSGNTGDRGPPSESASRSLFLSSSQATSALTSDRFSEALRMALIAMRAHRLRTFLTMLGIIIGIASVVSIVQLGQGAQRRILSDISSIGTNTVDIYPGKSFGDTQAAAIHTLIPADADALERQSFVDSVTPAISTQGTVRYANISASGMVNGVGDQYFRVHGTPIVTGISFDRASVLREAQVVVIDEHMRDKLFPHDPHPLGKVILIGNVPCRVIGVAATRSGLLNSGEMLNVWVPYTTAMIRILGQPHLRSITIRISDSVSVQAAEQSIESLIRARHGTQDFFLFNTDIIRQTVRSTTTTLTLFVSAIAVISLIVGGIGVMNIMLVSVTERTREIGVRMAVGARQSDIMAQFLVEAVLVCLVGGMLGIGLALCLGILSAQIGGRFAMAFSPLAMLAAFGCSTLIGVVFGYLPARSAARLDPIAALARE